MGIGTIIYFLIIIGLFLGISKGIGSLSGTLRGIAFFSMEKAPVGLVDLFSKKKDLQQKHGCHLDYFGCQ